MSATFHLSRYADYTWMPNFTIFNLVACFRIICRHYVFTISLVLLNIASNSSLLLLCRLWCNWPQCRLDLSDLSHHVSYRFFKYHMACCLFMFLLLTLGEMVWSLSTNIIFFKFVPWLQITKLNWHQFWWLSVITVLLSRFLKVNLNPNWTL